MGKKTALYEAHLALNARMVDFAGFDMPLHYGSQVNEHLSVRQHAGIFDVSHMNIVDITGEKAKDFLCLLLANDVSKLYPNKALYSCMLNEKGGVVDDLIAYMISEKHYRLILNASTKEKDMKWLNQWVSKDVSIKPREDLSIIALQGPHAKKIAKAIFNFSFEELKPFHFIEREDFTIARTGYTGEDGFEILIKNDRAVNVWKILIDAGAHPVGLGARDTLRLEAGLNLYGQDMNENTSPYESNLGWTISLNSMDRDFIGRKGLSENVSHKFVGFILEKGGILRHDQKVFADNKEIGVITSGGFSPTLNCSIALARIENKDFSEYFVQVRDKLLSVKLTGPAFVRKGKPV